MMSEPRVLLWFVYDVLLCWSMCVGVVVCGAVSLAPRPRSQAPAPAGGRGGERGRRGGGGGRKLKV